MNAGRLWLTALVVVAALAAAVVLTAESSVNGAPRGAILGGGPTLGAPPDLSVALGDCSMAPSGGPSAVRLTGPCDGTLGGSFACVSAGEFQALSASAPVGHGNELYVTILLFDFAGPGVYFEDELSVQVIGPEHVPRWTSLGSSVTITLSASGVYRLSDATLLPELGTSATGVIGIGGRLECR